ncbi:hypothetical protein [Porphyrobacter sp. GA68]|uniref:hypothetical protein n=1 Tax=Porphyrobacter sp. GA68 TaxID=2883480 RepID=UPI001D191CB3|nr:hypothetical protein [Porphyrobacter sp. GA68]
MRRVYDAAACAAALLMAGCASSPSLATAPASPAGTQVAASDGRAIVRDAAALDRLLNNAGVTLQWIGWNQRGSAFVREEGGVVHLTASQVEVNGPGSLYVTGRVTEIGSDYFTFAGRIDIVNTPDRGRTCSAERADWRFAVTQNRPYWRLRDFEWCDDLTDYIDIYFPGTRP